MQQIIDAKSDSHWLRNYYFTRATVAAGWVALAFTAGQGNPEIAGLLLIAYPAWDAIANWADVNHNGGLRQNRSQALNLAVSLLTAIAVAIGLGSGMHTVLAIFGAWAVLAGIFQLVTALRRWKSYGAQWVMILSGAQSAVVGALFINQASGPITPTIATIAPYAGLGAFYFLLSAIWLTVAAKRHRIA